MKTRCWQWLVAAVLFVSPSGLRAADIDGEKPAAPPEDAAAAKALPATNSPATAVQVPSNVAPASIIPPKLSLPPLLDQVVRLSQSGTDEGVVRAYVEKAASPYQITGNDIIQLQDLGVSKNVILSLIEHSKTATQPASEAPASAPSQTAQAPTPPSSDTPAPPPADAASDYYSALAPYGSWADVPGYGWCWQPTVVVVNSGWQPYWDNGYWAWSDCGWYWNSYYSWGWAPFHYGRWFSHNNGWYWCPDRVWGPSWVCWRNTPTHCGWAALPPGACFTAGVGWSHHGVSVGVGFGFGIASVNFNFVSHDHFTDHHVSHHGLHGHDANTAYAHSSVVNDYRVGANGRVFNHGIGREQIAAASGRPIQPVSATGLTRRGRELSTRTFTASNRGQSGVNSVNAFQSGRTAMASAAPRSIGQNSPASAVQRTAPNYSTANRASTVQQQPFRSVQQQPSFRNNYAAATPRGSTMLRANSVPRMSTAPQYQPRYSGGPAGRSTIAPGSFSPQAAAPRQFAPQSFGSRPSGGGSSFGGGFSRGGSMSVGRSFGGHR